MDAIFRPWNRAQRSISVIRTILIQTLGLLELAKGVRIIEVGLYHRVGRLYK